MVFVVNFLLFDLIKESEMPALLGLNIFVEPVFGTYYPFALFFS